MIHKYFRTSNQIERLNKELKRRSKVIGVFPNEDSLIRLMGAVLMERNSLNSELAGLGFFKGKQKEAIKNSIKNLEIEKNKIMTGPGLVLPEQPIDSDTLILPEKPIKKAINQNVDAEGILYDEFEKKGIEFSRRFVELGSYKGINAAKVTAKRKMPQMNLQSKTLHAPI